MASSAVAAAGDHPETPANRRLGVQLVHESGRRHDMNLSAPKQITFWIAVALAVLGLVFKLVPTLSGLGLAGWLILIGFVILAAGNLLEDL